MGPGSASVACELAGPGIDAVAHVLAWVRVLPGAPTLVRAASLFDPRYVGWCEASLDPAAVAPITRDAPLLGALLAAAEEGHLLQALLGLHHDPAVLRRAAALDLDAPELAGRRWCSPPAGHDAHTGMRSSSAMFTTPLRSGGRVVAGHARDSALEPVALDAVRRLARTHPELVEITRCLVGLVVGPYAVAYRDVVRPELEARKEEVEAAVARLVETLPSLAGVRVGLSHPLGTRGRVLPGMLLVGAPSRWSGVEPPTTAAVIAHEHAVQLAGEVVERDPRLDAVDRWALAERLALDAVRLRVREGPVAEAHRAHVASLDTSALPRDPLGPLAAACLEELLDRLGDRGAPALPRDGERAAGT